MREHVMVCPLEGCNEEWYGEDMEKCPDCHKPLIWIKHHPTKWKRMMRLQKKLGKNLLPSLSERTS